MEKTRPWGAPCQRIISACLGKCPLKDYFDGIFSSLVSWKWRDGIKSGRVGVTKPRRPQTEPPTLPRLRERAPAAEPRWRNESLHPDGEAQRLDSQCLTHSVFDTEIWPWLFDLDLCAAREVDLRYLQALASLMWFHWFIPLGTYPRVCLPWSMAPRCKYKPPPSFYLPAPAILISCYGEIINILRPSLTYERSLFIHLLFSVWILSLNCFQPVTI